MESHEILKVAIDRAGAKQVASDLGVSTSLIYKWCEKPPEDENDDASGARNPLDRVAGLIRSTACEDPATWLCQQADGFFVRNPELKSGAIDGVFIANMQRMIRDFSELLRVMSDSITNDNRVDCHEADCIRDEWQTLKQYGEQVVCACERGLFRDSEED